MLSKHRRRCYLGGAPVEAHRPAWHFEWAYGRVLHRLHDATALEIEFLGQLHRIEDGACRDPGVAKHAHGFAFVVLARPSRDHRIDLRLALLARDPGFEARIADQLLAADHLE